jgi:hypothetical protein
MDRDQEIERLAKLARWLDSRFRIPFTGIRFGADSIFGLVPFLGDGASILPALYLLHRAKKLGAPLPLQNQMLANIAIDFAVGAIPILGDIFDVTFKANRRNIALLRRHMSETRAKA